MPPKWNRKICIQKIEESPLLPSPLEANTAGAGGNRGPFGGAADKIRQLLGRGKPPEIV